LAWLPAYFSSLREAARFTAAAALQADPVMYYSASIIIIIIAAVGITHSGVSPVVNNVVDARRRMKHKKFTPLVPRNCQRIGLVDPTSQAHAHCDNRNLTIDIHEIWYREKMNVVFERHTIDIRRTPRKHKRCF